MEPIVKLRNVSFTPSFEEDALKNINLTIERGSINVLLGDSMAGCRLLLQLLNSLVPQEIPGVVEGDVIVDGVNVKEKTVKEMSTHVGVVLEDPAFMVVALTVAEDAAFGPANLGLDTPEIQERVNDVLERTRLKGFENRNPSTLSGGELQACAIGGILAMRPKVICLIDPIARLDPIGKAFVYSSIKDLNEKYGLTIIIHEPGMSIEAIAGLADKMIVLKKGEIILEGTPKDVFEDKYVQDLGLPQVTELFLKLREIKPKIQLPITLEEAEEEIRKLLHGRKIEVPKKTEEVEVKRKEPIITVRNVRHVYPSYPPVVALDGINLDISKGEFVGLIGPNGGGKTTLAHHLVGLLKPTNKDSEIIVDGLNIKKADLSEVTDHINYSFQNPDDQMFCETVKEELSFSLRKKNIPEEKINKMIESTLEYFNISQFKDWYISRLPRDVKTYVAEATIVAMDPKILIIDEPTGSLDTWGAKRMMESLKRLNEAGKTIIMITHDQKIVAEYCKRVIVIKNGKILLDGTPRKVYSKYKILRDAQLEPPQITRLGQVLSDLGFPDDIISVDEMFELIAPHID